jgi:TM2 domain-containing membrane protein YozV
MRKPFCFFLWVVIFIFTTSQGKSIDVLKNPVKGNRIFSEIKKPLVSSQTVYTDSVKESQKKMIFHKKHRLFAALLAFPLGVFGLHRMYLHTSAKIPLIYIATFGGGFGILPFIDFVLILLNRDIHTNYTSNPHLFMWEKRGLIRDSLTGK